MTDAPVAVSPLRRRMIDDMTLPQPVAGHATILPACRDKAVISAARRSGWGWRMCAPSGCTWCRRASPGRRSTRRFARCGSFTA